MKEKIIDIVIFTILIVLVIMAILYSTKFYTASCEDFKQFPLSYGYAPARCIGQ